MVKMLQKFAEKTFFWFVSPFGKSKRKKKPSVSRPAQPTETPAKPNASISTQDESATVAASVPAFHFHPIDLPSSWVRFEDFDDCEPNKRLAILDQTIGKLSDGLLKKEAVLPILNAFQVLSWPKQDGITMSDGELSQVVPSAAEALAFGPEACFELSDIWFANRQTLRLRTKPKRLHGQTFHILRCFQRDPHSGRGVRLLAEQPVSSEIATFVDVEVANPYLPLLLSISDYDCETLALAILPFPSLCRGGIHHGELASGGPRKPYLLALKEFSSFLLQPALKRSGQAALKRIEIDIESATGTELCFSPALHYWLRQVLGLRIDISPAPAAMNEEVRAYLTSALGADSAAVQSPPSIASATLKLPADAVPSLQGLLIDWSIGLTVRDTGFIIASTYDNMPRWLILPPKSGRAVGSSVGPASIFPTLVASDLAAAAPGNADGIAPVSAIRFCRFGAVDEAYLVYPMPSDETEPAFKGLLRSGELPSISILYSYSGSEKAMIASLESVALQQGAKNLRVLVAGSVANRPLIVPHLQRLFPDAGQYIASFEGEDPGVCLNRLSAMAESELLLFLTEPVLLHDPRSLRILSSMMTSSNVASVSCMLIGPRRLKKNLIKPAPVCAGYYPRIGVSGELDQLASGIEDVLFALPPTAWPTTCNSSRMFMARTKEWLCIGGFDGQRQPHEELPTTFWANAIDQGRTHLTTTAMTASLQPVEDNFVLPYTAAKNRMPDLRNAEKVSLQVRRLVA
ncbi:hypothetical protein EV128_116143 [Rhizobium azibense]|nr:hypothetical protein EV128_116143 [Rhizobium azibense]